MGKKKPRHIAITGHSGSGKSTYGKELSKELGLPLVRLDRDKGFQRAYYDASVDKDIFKGRLGRASRKAAVRALRKRKSSVIEGTHLLGVPEKKLKRARVIMMQVEKHRMLKDRLARQKRKVLEKGRDWDKLEAKKHRDSGERIFGMNKEKAEAFAKRPNVEFRHR